MSGSVVSTTPSGFTSYISASLQSAVSNTGSIGGVYTVSLLLNGSIEDSKDITLAAGETSEVSFTVTRDMPGTYLVEINGLSDSFTVSAPASFELSDLSVSHAEVDSSEEVTVQATLTNTGETEGVFSVALRINGSIEAVRDVMLGGGESRQISFTTVKDAAGTYLVEIDGLSASFVVQEKPLAAWVWVLISLAIVAIIAGMAVLVLRRIS
ncbi:CARDB domain-containing protein [Chloroflexota bacterium]